MDLPVIPHQDDVLDRIGQDRMLKNLSVSCLALMVHTVARNRLVFMEDDRPFPEPGNIFLCIVPAVFAPDRILPADNMRRTEEIGNLGDRIVHQRIGMHDIIRVDQDHLFLVKELFFTCIVITVLADQDVPVADDLAPVIVPGNSRDPVEDQGIGGQRGLVVLERDIAADIGDLCIAVVAQRVSIQVQGIAGPDVHIPERLDLVLYFVHISAVAIKVSTVVAHDHIPDDPLDIRPDIPVVFPAVGFLEKDLCGFLREGK